MPDNRGMDPQRMRLAQVLRRPNRLLLLLILLSAVTTGVTWVTIRVRQNSARRAAYQQIWQMGANVAFQDEENYVMPVTRDEWSVENGKSWIEDVSHDRRPTSVLFAGRVGHRFDVTDDDVDRLIALLSQLPTVKTVYLDATTISTAGESRLRKALPGVSFQSSNVVRFGAKASAS